MSAPSERGLKFADWFRRELTLPAMRLAPRWRTQWAKCFDDLCRRDHREELEIAMVCRWARGEPAVRGAAVSKASLFWRKNFRTPLKLRDRDGEEVMYYDVFAELMWTELGAGPAFPPERLQRVALCHTAFCEAAKVAVPVRFYAQQWRTLLDSPEYEGEEAKLAGDVRHVVWFLARGIATGKRNVGALKLGTLLEPQRFFEERADARKHGRGYFQTDAAKSATALHDAGTTRALPAKAAPDDAERALLMERAKREKTELRRQLYGGEA